MIWARCRLRSNFTSHELSWLQNGHSKSVFNVWIRRTVFGGFRLLFFRPMKKKNKDKTKMIILYYWRHKKKTRTLFAILFFTGVDPWIINIDGFAQIYNDEIEFFVEQKNRDAYNEWMWRRFLDTFDRWLFPHWICVPWRNLLGVESRREMSGSYICTSQDWSCEQNGHGNARVKAVIRFCLGGGLRFDLRLPMLERINKTDDDDDFPLYEWSDDERTRRNKSSISYLFLLATSSEYVDE